MSVRVGILISGYGSEVDSLLGVVEGEGEVIFDFVAIGGLEAFGEEVAGYFTFHAPGGRGEFFGEDYCDKHFHGLVGGRRKGGFMGEKKAKRQETEKGSTEHGLGLFGRARKGLFTLLEALPE